LIISAYNNINQLANQFKHDNVIIDDANNKDKGPLAGIHTVMKQYNDEELFFVIIKGYSWYNSIMFRISSYINLIFYES
jgi:hypothetical protein